MNSKTRNLTAAAQVDFSFLNGRNILITGGTGSFGRASSRALILANVRPQRSWYLLAR